MNNLIKILTASTLLVSCGGTSNDKQKSAKPSPQPAWTNVQENKVMNHYGNSLDSETYEFTLSNKKTFGDCALSTIKLMMDYQKWEEEKPELTKATQDKCIKQADIKLIENEEVNEEEVDEATDDQVDQPEVIPPFSFQGYLDSLKENLPTEMYIKDIDENVLSKFVNEITDDLEKYDAAYKIIDEGLLDSIYQQRTLGIILARVPKIKDFNPFQNFIDNNKDQVYMIREILDTLSSHGEKNYYRYSIILHVLVEHRDNVVLLNIAYQALKQFGYFEEALMYFPSYDLTMFVDARSDSENSEKIKETFTRLLLGVQHLSTICNLFKAFAENQGDLENSRYTEGYKHLPSYFLKYKAMKRVKERGDLSNIDPGVKAFIQHPNFDKYMETVDKAYQDLEVYKEYVGI